MSDQEHPLRLYDSLSRDVRPFVPQDASRVTMYNCGPTVYSYAHIGNARAAVVADVLFRVLRHIYGEEAVVYARNITDVDDKIIAAAIEQGVPISEITEKYARIYNEDLAALNCLPPTHQPKATEHIQQMADLIVTLLDKEVAYEMDGHVYFDVTKDEDYGDLSGRRLEDNLAGARVEVASVKRNPADFVLWKPARDGEPGWSQQESSSSYRVDWRNHANKPFANVPGRPGWHIECSAMIREVLGETIDIHCGGIDLKFPHHENEIAQSECATGEKLAHWWVHNEFLNMSRPDGNKEKMSKSLGNVVLVHDLLKDWDGEVIRLALLKAHYRNELVWSEDLLRESKTQLDGWYRAKMLIHEAASNSGVQLNEFHDPMEFATKTKVLRNNDGEILNPGEMDKIYTQWSTTFLFDDLNMIGSAMLLEQKLQGLRKFYSIDRNWSSDEEAYSFIKRAIGQILFVNENFGLLQRDPEDWFRGNASTDETAEFETLAAARQAARQAKDWAEADRIRDEGTARGIVFEDGLDGTTWRKA
ncbi:cysteine--tRNA ligase [uncultured Algimonas sp.]|uniref:cysteine--tRNA ligase n=1 Tax=uncultured Algimonas sp. TaxID=1547920 RepID=UPI002608CD30|nr:cysteine--tRNA ligase [uncultured Algimonas sp.]